jgi:hypothetical protein
MKRLTLVAAMFALSGTAVAAGNAVNTELEIQGSGYSCIDGRCDVSGQVLVTSNKKACVEGRKVHFTLVYGSGKKVKFDTDRATSDGYAAGFGAVKDGNLAKIVAKAPAIDAGKTKCRKAKDSKAFFG